MRGLLGTLLIGSLFAIGYVLFNGVTDTYELFDSGIVLTGWSLIGAAVAAGGGALAASASWGEAVTEGPDGSPSMVTAFRPGLVGVAVVLFVVAGFLIFGRDPPRTSADLAVGECFEDPGDGEVGSVDVIPCAEPHDAEVYYVSRLTGGPLATYPGNDQLVQEAEAVCLERFDAFVGMAYADSVLDVAYFTPTRDSWEVGDRYVVCAVYRLDFRKMTGTARGSRQ